jgi:hypothetical protein
MSLDRMNKADIIEFAEKLLKENEALQAAPLTSAALERKNLDLEKEIISIKDRAIARNQSYELQIAQIKADTEKAIRKLELDHSSNEGLDAKELDLVYKSLEEKAEKSKKDLTFGLKEAEANQAEKLAKLQEELDKADAEANGKLKELADSILNAKEEAKKTIADLKVNNEREIEQIKYDHKIAIRDERLSTAEVIAGKYDRIVVIADEYAELTQDMTKIKEEFEKTLKAETSKSFNAGKAAADKDTAEEIANLKNANALLENDKKYLTEGNAALQVQVDKLSKQVESIPDQIAKAVESAKSTINVDNKVK